MAEKMDCATRMNDSIHKAHKIADAIKQLQKQTEQYSKRFDRESEAHTATKKRGRALEEDTDRTRREIEKEREEHAALKRRMADIERFHTQSSQAMKSMSEDLKAVRTQNEALQAEIERQRKAFVVSVDWAQMHADMKAKLEGLLQDTESMQVKHVQTKKDLEEALTAQQDCKAAREQVLDAIQRAKDDLAKGEEFAKCAKLTEDVAAQLGETGNLREILASNAAKRRKQREKARNAMEKSLMANDQLVIGTVFNSWERLHKDNKLSKSKKHQNRAMAMRGIANSDLAIQDFCLTAWHKLMQEAKRLRLEEANRALAEKYGQSGRSAEIARRKALAQLEKQFGDQDKSLLRETYAAWQSIRHDRMKKERAKAIAARSISSKGDALIQQVVHGWVAILVEAIEKRERKAAGQARALRMIADGDNAMLDFCLTQWAALTRQALATKRAKDDGNKKALRMMADSQSMLVKQCFPCWMQLVQTKHEREAKMKAVERGLVQGGAALQQYIMQNWKGLVDKKNMSNAKKEVSMRAGLKKIKNNEVALMADLVSMWCKEARTGKQRRLEEEMEEKRRAPADPDPEQLRNETEAQELRAKLEEMKTQFEDMLARFRETQDLCQDADKRAADLDKKYDKASQELQDSRKKAKEINEELTRVGQFLLNRARKPSSRPTSGKGDIDEGKLPRIDHRAPLTAREYRPDSGGSRGKIEIAPIMPPAKEAWLEST